MTTSLTARVPAGVPTGGQFSAREREEAPLSLVDPWGAAPAHVDAVMEHNKQAMADLWDRAADLPPTPSHLYVEAEEPDVDDWVSGADADRAADRYFAPRDY